MALSTLCSRAPPIMCFHRPNPSVSVLSASASSSSCPEPRRSLHILPARTPRLCTLRVVTRSSTSGSLEVAGGEGGSPGQGGGRGGGGGGGGGREGDGDEGFNEEEGGVGPVEVMRRGWRRRVRVDPQFGFKVFSEGVIGVAACVLGDMASRPGFGLSELDFVFSTAVVGILLNFTLMYLLAPTPSTSRLPLLFAACPPAHMFEPGNFSLLDRAGTFLFKGMQFSAVGLVAGLAGTALSNLLLALRKGSLSAGPPVLLNALTWAAHMGVSSNARYQTLNGLEFALAGALHPPAFKAAVFLLRGLNNACGGITFVMLARRTGAQSVASPPVEASASEAKEGLVLAEERI